MTIRPTYANIASTLALVVALGSGGSYAAGHLGRNSVASKQIKNGTIKTVDLGDGSVTGAKVAPGAVTSSSVANGSLNAEDLAPGVVKGVPQATVQFDEATADLADGAKGTYTVFCPAGQQAISGGGRGDFDASEETTMTSSRPVISAGNPAAPDDGQGFLGWRATFVNSPGGATTGIRPDVWAVCMPAS